MIEYENLRLVNEKVFKENEDNFINILKSGWYILGNQVKNFEKEFANYCSSDHCVGVASGLDALILTINSFNFPKDSEIIVPANTYIASILAIIRNGLKPVLVEPDIKTYNLDTNKIEEKITKNTKAILAVHLYGKPCDMDPILSIAKKNDLKIIEDASQAHGAKYKGKIVGSFGIGCFSFYPTKNLGAIGDAGAITAKDLNFVEKLKSLRNYGSSKKYQNDYVGYNSRLDEIQAGFLSIKLKLLDKINSHKRALANIYLENLSDKFFKPIVHKDFFDVYHIFNIRCDKRDELKKYLFENGITTEIHYPIPPHKQKAMKIFLGGEYPITEKIHETTLSLPISYCHSKDDVFKVCKMINSWRK